MTIDLTRRVVCAANRAEDILLVGPRHWDSTMHTQYDALEMFIEGDMPSRESFEQGFINTWGEFLTRKQAWVVASNNNQIIRFVGSQTVESLKDSETKLYSENLY
jgi:plasmid maintenance system killer protein